jgi:hypothetical protein
MQIEMPPEIPPYPSGLPLPKKVPEGVLLPTPLDNAVFDKLLFLDIYPSLCQNTISVNLEHTVDLALREIATLEAIHAEEKLQLEARVARGGNWSPWLVATLGIGVAVLAGGLGYFIGKTIP